MLEAITLRRELLRDIRRPKTQAWLARRLKVSKTQVHRWERGINKMKWQHFLLLCRARNRGISEAIESVTAGKANQDESPASLIKFLAAGLKTGEIAERLGRSRFTVSRWFSSRAEPDLDDVLAAFIAIKPLLLRPFLHAIVSKTFERDHTTLFHFPQIEVDLTYKYPVIALILRSLELKAYQDADKHTEGYIAAKAGISLSEELAMLKILAEAGLIDFDGYKYRVVNSQLDTRGDFKGTLRIRKYWLERTIQFLDKIESLPNDAIFRSNVFSVSRSTYTEIKDLYLNFFEELRSTIARDQKSAEIVAVLSMNIFDPCEQLKLAPRAVDP